jgi:3-deoxy-manno-octulosonate cytidylyltransferase (CMP-KDO synthetase)
MVEHVWRRTRMSDSVDATYVATPDAEIRDEIERIGGDVIMTGKHTRATDRVAEAARSVDAGIVVVMQGDEPLVYPEMIDAAVAPVLAGEARCANLAKRIETVEEFEDPNNVKVTVDEQWDALYFSRAPIPNLHAKTLEEAALYLQVCVIPFEREFLFEFSSMEQTALERAESIDMLRLLEHGEDVSLVETGHETYPVDTPGDREKVDQMMADDALFTTYAGERSA